MPARFALNGVVRHHRSREPHRAVRLVARGPRGEIVARTRTDDGGAFAFDVPLAVLRGLRWRDPDAPSLTVELDRLEESVELAGEPLPWALTEEPAPDVVVWVRQPGEGPLSVLAFEGAGPSPAPPPAEPLWIAAMAGLALALERGALAPSELGRWLPDTSLTRLADGALSDPAVELTRRALADPDRDGVLDDALDLLAALAREEPGDPWL